MPATGLTTRQAAEILGISVQAVHYLVKGGRLRAWCWGDRLVISRSSVLSYKRLRETLAAERARQKLRGQAVSDELKRRKKR